MTTDTTRYSTQSVLRDLLAGLIVFLVALPLCLGIALASGAPLFSGLIAGIIGGVVVGILSGSHTSVTGPAAGLTAIVAGKIANLGSFEAFLLAVVIGGLLQIGLGVFKAGALSAFFPFSVIKGLLAAIGIILILKQIPHLLGHEKDPQGELSFVQPDHGNTFSELLNLFQVEIHQGAVVIGILSLGLLMLWDKLPPLRKSLVPAPLIVVLLGIGLGQLFSRFGAAWVIESSHMVQVPVANSVNEFLGFLKFPDFSQILNPAVYIAGITIAVVASLETLLNLDAIDKLDRKQRLSPPSRELWAQGIGNVAAGLIGGLPMTSVVIRGSVNINAGAESKISAIFHGALLLICVVALPNYLNTIPLSCLAAILLLTGYKLASPKLFKQMGSEGKYQFIPFMVTLVAIVFTDLLIGILIGLAISVIFILNSNLRRPIRRIREQHLGGEVLHIELANQVSFLNRAALESALREAPRGTRVLIDARRTDYIDPDILSLIREFKNVTAPVYNVQVGLRGFREKYLLQDSVETVDFAPQELRDQLTPAQVLDVLIAGNRRYAEGHPLDRDLRRQADSNGEAPQPMAAVFTGIDSRTPIELIFDLGMGDAYVVRIPGNVPGPRAVGGLEFACLDGVKLILVMGHTGSRLVKTAIERLLAMNRFDELSDCNNLEPVLSEIAVSVDPDCLRIYAHLPETEKQEMIDQVARRHVLRSAMQVEELSPSIRRLVAEGKVGVAAALYDVKTGLIEILSGREDIGGSLAIPSSTHP